MELVSSQYGGSKEDEKLSRQLLADVVETPAAHFVVDAKLLELTHRKEVLDSFHTMVKHGIRALPFDPMLLEWRDPGSRTVLFVRVQTKPLPLPDKLPQWMYENGKDWSKTAEHDVLAYPVLFTNAGNVMEPDMVLVSGCDAANPIRIHWGGGEDGRAFRVSTYLGGVDAKLREHIAIIAAEGMALAMLMLNNKSVDKVHIDTEALSRARLRNHKCAIRPYTLLRIGTIYDRHGREVTHTGRHMPVHWRCAHVRQQKYGPGWSKVKPILIPACLVNFATDTDVAGVPLPKHEVVE